MRIIGAALLSRGSHNVEQGRKFLTTHRMLVAHTLKRSAGLVGGKEGDQALDERVDELADGLMVLIAATGFLEVSYQAIHVSALLFRDLTCLQYEDGVLPQPKPQNQALFH